jgi:hypothetical protein
MAFCPFKFKQLLEPCFKYLEVQGHISSDITAIKKKDVQRMPWSGDRLEMHSYSYQRIHWNELFQLFEKYSGKYRVCIKNAQNYFSVAINIEL